jgi:hypothetical protein
MIGVIRVIGPIAMLSGLVCGDSKTSRRSALFPRASPFRGVAIHAEIKNA